VTYSPIDPLTREESFEAAWSDLSAVLPELWYIESIRRDWHHSPPRWWVRLFRPKANANTETRDGPDADSPVAALRAFAARLRDERT
jgi:hypothetical protein